jgi:hypothetical protein
LQQIELLAHRHGHSLSPWSPTRNRPVGGPPAQDGRMTDIILRRAGMSDISPGISMLTDFWIKGQYSYS